MEVVQLQIDKVYLMALDRAASRICSDDGPYAQIEITDILDLKKSTIVRTFQVLSVS